MNRDIPSGEVFARFQRDGAVCIRGLLDAGELAPAAARLMQSGTARLCHDHMLTKEPAARQPTPWHQDQPNYNIEGRQNVSFWMVSGSRVAAARPAYHGDDAATTTAAKLPPRRNAQAAI